MILGLGVDIVDVVRFDRVLGRWGERFQRRVFTDDEVAYSSRSVRPGQHLAARFAAKEAFIKALGGRGPVGLREIEVTRDPSGAPGLRLHGRAQDLMALMGGRPHLSLSHDGDHAIAMVVLEEAP